ncbi:GNAT family N-acetyltransferase [Rossellomorea vietnamensis]|uniref:GNAT family N-acetyltransferase n=1 Tax=Rossellomorea vietnamensis TaxID=218284 RepID=A0ACD4C694_9BACI|nr:GNAT family N-acetyltransferase [Rossellomorea vietnamensis]UXH44068.1 GNAT family N-acetyltransferase [Rossellomorea vietnamensis]WQI95427.1 GNAT family N-acetyltransferase [Rossellomorea vietnamensis]WQI95438.1 GNAT family N-acetyltransferase [Rossellomorea vietnamensis]
MQTHIREATKNDYDAVHRIQRQVHEMHTKERPDHYQMADTTLDRQYFNSLIDGENTKVFILEEGQPIAYTILTIKSPVERPILIPKKVVYMDDFGVDQTLRGKGLGKKFFGEVVEYAKTIGADSLELGVWEFNEDAIKFYESMNLRTKSRMMEIRL